MFGTTVKQTDRQKEREREAGRLEGSARTADDDDDDVRAKHQVAVGGAPNFVALDLSKETSMYYVC